MLNEIELLVALRGETSIIHMKDYEVGDDYVHMVMECGEQDLAQALQRKQVRPTHSHTRSHSHARTHPYTYTYI